MWRVTCLGLHGTHWLAAQNELSEEIARRGKGASSKQKAQRCTEGFKILIPHNASTTRPFKGISLLEALRPSATHSIEFINRVELTSGPEHRKGFPSGSILGKMCRGFSKHYLHDRVLRPSPPGSSFLKSYTELRICLSREQIKIQVTTRF